MVKTVSGSSPSSSTWLMRKPIIIEVKRKLDKVVHNSKMTVAAFRRTPTDRPDGRTDEDGTRKQTKKVFAPQSPIINVYY